MTGDYVILRLFLIKILYSHTNMVSGLSGQKDTWWGTECSVGLAMTAAAHRHGLSNRLLLFSPPLFALSCFVAQDGLKLPILLPELLLASISHYTWILFLLLRASWRRGSNQSPSQKNAEGSYSRQISSSGISGNSYKEHVWVGVEGLSQCEWRETWVSRYRHQVKKKFSAAALTWKPLVAGWAEVYLEMAIIYQSWSHFKVVEEKGSFFWWKFCSKNFFFGVRRKEKTPHQYAEKINVYANEITNQENNENKRTKWTLMDMCCEHANRHTHH